MKRTVVRGFYILLEKFQLNKVLKKTHFTDMESFVDEN